MVITHFTSILLTITIHIYITLPLEKDATMVIKPQAKRVKNKWLVGFLSVLLTSKACSKLLKKLPFAYSVCRYIVNNSHTDNSLAKHVEVEFK